MTKLLRIVLVCFLFSGTALSKSLDISEQNLRNLEFDSQGFLQNVGSDGYLAFRNLDVRRDQACGISMSVQFREPMFRPGVFEVFWHTAGQGFSEQHKAIVLINQEDTRQAGKFLIPLCKLFHFSGNINKPEQQAAITGLRIDYPANRSIAIRFDSLLLLDAAQTRQQLQQRPPGVTILEPYERLSPYAFASFDVAVPKLFFALEEGLRRLWQDKAFLIFWLLLIVLLKVLILRSVLRQDTL